MIAAQNVKDAVMFSTATIATNATTASTEVDTLGFSYLTVRAFLPKASATDSSAKWTVLKLQEGDTTSSYSDVTGFTGTTNTTAAAGEFVLPVHNNTSVSQCVRMHIKLGGSRKRYLRLVAQAPASHGTVGAFGSLSAPDTFAVSATNANVGAIVIG